MTRQEKWDIRFLRLAKEYASWSKDPSTKVGAVLVRDTNVQVSQGYNGFPKNDPDLKEDYLDRQVKLSKILHAEHNAFNRVNEDLSGCTLYTYPMEPCSDCAEKYIIPNGITRVVSVKPTSLQIERWGDSFQKSRLLFEENKIELVLYDRDTYAIYE